MSLQLKISAIEEQSSFIVYNCTGNYRFDNLGGFGGPNPQIKRITKSTLFITPPNLPETSEPIEIDVTNDFPNSEDLGYEILPYQIGLPNAVLISGKYKIKLVVSGTDSKGIVYTTSTVCEKVFSKAVKCCVDKLSKYLDKYAFKDEKQKKIIELNNLIESMDYSIDKELFDNAVSIIDYLAEQCVCPGC